MKDLFNLPHVMTIAKADEITQRERQIYDENLKALATACSSRSIERVELAFEKTGDADSSDFTITHIPKDLPNTNVVRLSDQHDPVAHTYAPQAKLISMKNAIEHVAQDSLQLYVHQQGSVPVDPGTTGTILIKTDAKHPVVYVDFNEVDGETVHESESYTVR